MDEQKVSSCSFSLFQALAELAEDIEPGPSLLEGEIVGTQEADDKAANVRAAMADEVHVLTEGLDPKLTYRKAREVMTRSVGRVGAREWLCGAECVADPPFALGECRPDYLVDLDHQNIIHIDVHHAVRPDSRLMLSCFKRIAAEDDFQEKVSPILDRARARGSLF